MYPGTLTFLRLLVWYISDAILPELHREEIIGYISVWKKMEMRPFKILILPRFTVSLLVKFSSGQRIVTMRCSKTFLQFVLESVLTKFRKLIFYDKTYVSRFARKKCSNDVKMYSFHGIPCLKRFQRSPNSFGRFVLCWIPNKNFHSHNIPHSHWASNVFQCLNDRQI